MDDSRFMGLAGSPVTVHVERSPGGATWRVFLNRKGRYMTLRWFLWDESDQAEAYACRVFDAITSTDFTVRHLTVEGGQVVEKG